MTDAEYSALRSELNFWQNVRLTIVGFDFAFLGGALASDGLTKNPWVAVVIVVAVLVGSVLFVWFAARSTICIGAYIQVFYEEPSGQPGWQMRMRHWSFTPFTLFRHILGGLFGLMLLLAYLPVARAAFTPPPPATDGTPPAAAFDPLWGTAAVVLTLVFVATVVAFLTASRGYLTGYLDRWRTIRGAEPLP